MSKKVIAVVNHKSEQSASQKYDIGFVYFRVKAYAEKHPVLFTAICSALVAVVSFIIRLWYVSYMQGFFTFLGINVDKLSINDTDFLSKLALCIFAIGVMLLIFVAGYFSYKNAVLLWCFITEIVVTILITFFGLSSQCGFKVTWLFFQLKPLLALVLPLLLLAFSNAPLLLYALSSSDEFKILRIENKINRLSRSKYKIRKEKRLRSYNEKKDELQKHIKKSFKLTRQEKIVAFSFAIVVATIVVTGMLAFWGYQFAKNKTEYYTVDRTYLELDANINFAQYAVLYEGNDYALISPCQEENGILTINANQKIQVSLNNVLLNKQTYQKVVFSNSSTEFETIDLDDLSV